MNHLRALVTSSQHPLFFGRPTGGFGVASLLPASPIGKPTPAGRAKSYDRAIAAESLVLAARLDASPAAQRRAAIAHFVLGREKEAMEGFESIITRLSASQVAAAATVPMTRGEARDLASTYNDLAVLYATRAVMLDARTDFIRALSAAERAHRLDPRLIEARFNRALLLETFGLPEQAIAAWREFVEREPSNEWKHEAERHLAATMRMSPDRRNIEALFEHPPAARDVDRAPRVIDSIVRVRTLASRDYVIETLMAQWGDQIEHELAGRADMTRQRAMTIAQSIAALTGDRFALDTVRASTSAGASFGEPAGPRAVLAAAHRAYGEAMRLTAADQTSAAQVALQNATSGFTAAGSPMALLVRARLVPATPGRVTLQAIEAELALIERDAIAASYSGVLGLVYWKRGLLRVGGARLDDAIADYTRAIEAFTRARETEHVANVHSLMAEANRFLGEFERASVHHAAALQASASVWNPRIRHQILTQAASTSLALGEPDAALTFQEALLANARVWGAEGAQGIGFMQRAKAVAALGRIDRATQDLRQAAIHVGRIPDQEFRGRFDTELRVAELQVFAQSPARAIVAATSAIDRLRAQRSMLRVPQALLTRGLAREQTADVAGAEKDFLDGTALMEQQQSSLRDQPLQLSLLEQNAGLYRALAHLASDVKGSPADGLRHIEHMRARGLLDALSQAPDPVLDPLDVARAHPALTFLCYAFSGADLMIWSVRGQAVDYHVARGVRRGVSRAVIDLRVGLAEGRADDVTRTLREISKVVIEPIAASIDRADALVVLPDEELYAVPFAALSIGRGDEALARRHAITIAPGFSVFGRARAAAPSTFGGRVLVVAPAVRQAITLPAAVQEARDVASSYPRVTSLAGADATPERFLAGVAEHAIVHFAGHGVANEDQPAFSRLLFAATPRAAGGLLASDIARQRFPNTRLVVLGACESARGAIRSGEGVLSIARAFLVAGVPTVVGALWEVDDEMTRRLLKQFHNDIARGETPAAALRRAQLAMLSDANPMVRHPMSWAGFVVMEAGRRTPVK